jgi:hypothetical protein
MHRVLIGVALVLCMGCPKKDVIRNLEVYQAEVKQWDTWAVKQASYLRSFVEGCACDSEGPQFVEYRCEEAADWLLTVESRHEWHRQMALFNAYLIDEEPSASPPEIPPSTCPLPARR